MASNLSLPQPLDSLGIDADDLPDIAELNLRCAIGLPGAETIDHDACLKKLDEQAADVGRIIFLAENYGQFLHNPARFHHSQAYFCVVCMISVLKRKYGVRYNPKWKHITPASDIPDDFGRRAEDQFIHAILSDTGGTCGSLPVYFVAIGRRLGYPLRLVKALRHLFMRWDDPHGLWLRDRNGRSESKGEVFNIEATGPGVHRLSDEEYRTQWPHPIPDEHVEAGIYLKSLTSAEELSEFLAARAYCLAANRRYAEAEKTLACSAQLAEHNTLRAADHNRLRNWLIVRSRGPWINAPNPAIYDDDGTLPRGPHWIRLGGGEALVQVLSRDALTAPWSAPAEETPATRGLALQAVQVQMPCGSVVSTRVPMQTPAQPFEAYWAELAPNRFALVYRRVPPSGWPGHGPVLLALSTSRMHLHNRSTVNLASPHESLEIANALRLLKQQRNIERQRQHLLDSERLFLSPGCVPTPTALPPLNQHGTQPPRLIL